MRSPDAATARARGNSSFRLRKPVYKYIRLRWGKSNEDAKDLTQAFFTRALEKDFFASYDPAQAAFRTFRRSPRPLLAPRSNGPPTAASAGWRPSVPLDFETAEGELATTTSPTASLRKNISVVNPYATFTLAVSRSATGRVTGRQMAFGSSRATTSTTPAASPRSVGAEFALPVTTVTSYLGLCAAWFRRLVLFSYEISGGEEEFRAEARAIPESSPRRGSPIGPSPLRPSRPPSPDLAITS